MINNNGSEIAQPWYTEPWAWFVFMLPASVVIAGIATIIIAVKAPVSIVSADYYKEGLAINENMRQWKVAELLNLKASISVSEAGIEVIVNSDESNNLELVLLHPTDSLKDQSYKLEKNSKNRFSFSESLIENPGARYIKLSGINPEGEWLLKSKEKLGDTGYFKLELSARGE